MGKIEQLLIGIEQWATYSPDGKKTGVFALGAITGVEVFIMLMQTFGLM